MMERFSLTPFLQCQTIPLAIDPKLVFVLIASIAGTAFLCRSRSSGYMFYDSEEKDTKETQTEPIDLRKEYLEDALRISKQHRHLLEDEVKMLENWVDYLHLSDSEQNTNDTVEDLDRSILQFLDQNRENGMTAKGIFNYLKDFFEDLTKAEINQRLSVMKKEGVLKVSVKNKKDPIWFLQTQ
jgi:hypothetical protein